MPWQFTAIQLAIIAHHLGFKVAGMVVLTGLLPLLITEEGRSLVSGLYQSYRYDPPQER